MRWQRPLVVLCIGFGTCVAGRAQSPAVPSGPPTFGADSILPSGKETPTSLAPGMLVSIYGTGLGPAEPCEGRADPNPLEEPSPRRPNQIFSERLAYPTKLCGVRVEVGGEAAELLYVHDRQINFQVPQSAPVEGTAEITVIYTGRSSQPV